MPLGRLHPIPGCLAQPLSTHRGTYACPGSHQLGLSNTDSARVVFFLAYIGLDVNGRWRDGRRAKQRLRALAEKELEGYNFVDDITS